MTYSSRKKSLRKKAVKDFLRDDKYWSLKNTGSNINKLLLLSSGQVVPTTILQFSLWKKSKEKLLPKVATTEWTEVTDKNLHFVGLTNNAEMPDQIHILKLFCSSKLEVFVI